MTKYGHYLAALDRDCPRTFAGKFMRYKLLKKCLKECVARGGARAPSQGAAAAAGAADAGAVESSRARFFELLSQELRRANMCFVSTAQSIVACFQRTETRRRLACCFPRLLAAGPGAYAQLTERAYWCRKYARANAVALRKILKKYDKLCGGQRGRATLQQYWRLPAGAELLHSPLLDELKAIQDVLHDMRTQQEDVALTEVAALSRKSAAHAAADGGAKAAVGRAAACAPAPHPPAPLSPMCMLSSSDFEWAAEGEGCCGASQAGLQHSLQCDSSSWGSGGLSATCSFTPGASTGAPGGGSHATASTLQAGAAAVPPAAAAAAGPAAGGGGPAGLERTSAGRFRDEDLRCPICLDALYKPVGLTCGHKFCKQCALEHAGLRRAIGTFNNLLSYVSSTVACPQCRQPAVYKGAVRMRQLDRVVRSRFNREWQERRQEERARERALVVAAAAAQPHGRPVSWMHTLNARDALLAL